MVDNYFPIRRKNILCLFILDYWCSLHHFQIADQHQNGWIHES